MKLVIRSVFTLLILALSFTAVAQTPAPVTPVTLAPPIATSTQPLPNTLISSGVVTNYSSPYNVAPYVSVLAAVNSTSGSFPTYAGFSYEFYRNTAVGATNPIAYSGEAELKTVFYHKQTTTILGRVALFGDVALGGAGSLSSVSSVLKGGGGIEVQLGKYSPTNTPHWGVVVEPEYTRAPALASSSGVSLKVGLVYGFNRP